MSWPKATDFIEAVQDLRVSVEDEELRGGEVARTPLGLPMLWSGNFADVFKIHCPATGNTWALKCFTREVAGQCDRYHRIAAHLEQVQLPFTADFKYLEQGIRVGGRWFPALKMRWVEGLTLAEFVEEHLDRPGNLKMLLDLWVKLAARLREAGIAHADLQHGNVLLVPMSGGALALRLIDYDGMYVPALAGTRSGEVGHPAYQHPQRLREGTYNAEVDRFSHLAIYGAIRCLMLGRRELWQRFNNGDNLLFREQDFRAPEQSELFRSLWKTNDLSLRGLVGRLALACKQSLEEAPWVDQIVFGGQVRALTGKEEVRAAEMLAAGKATGMPPSPFGRGAGGEGVRAAAIATVTVLPRTVSDEAAEETADALADLAKHVRASKTGRILTAGTVPATPPRSRFRSMGRSLWGGLAAAIRRVDGIFRRLVGENNDILRYSLWAAMSFLLLASVAGVASVVSLPLLLSSSKPVPQIAVQPKSEEKKAPVNKTIDASRDKSADKTPAASKDPGEKKPEPPTDTNGPPKELAVAGRDKVPGPGAAAEKPQPAAASPRTLAAALSSPTNFEFKGTPLRDVIRFVRDRHRVEIQIDEKELKEAGLSAQTPVTISLEGISLASALSLALKNVGLTYTVKDDVLLISPAKQVPPSKPRNVSRKPQLSVAAALSSSARLAFVKTPLKDVADSLKDLHRVEIQLDNPALREAGVDSDTPITYTSGKGETLQSALDEILSPLMLQWIVLNNDVIVVTSPAKAESDQYCGTRVYKVLRPTNANLLIRQITSQIDPKSWVDAGGIGTIAPWPSGAVVINQSQKTLRLLQQRFAGLLRPIDPGLATPNKRKADSGVAAKLNQPIDLDFVATPLKDVVRYLTDLTKLQIRLDEKALKEAGVDTDTPISVHLRQVRLRTALILVVTNELQLDWGVTAKGLEITSPSVADGKLTPVSYDVGDVVAVAGNASLVDVITNTIDPKAWTVNGGTGTIEATRGGTVLEVRQTHHTHERIEQLLAALRLSSRP